MAADTLPNASPGDDRTACKLAARDHGGDRALARLRQVEPGSVVPVRAPRGGSGRSGARRAIRRRGHHHLGQRVGQFAFGQHRAVRSEEHTSELQSLMRISYAVFCLKKKTNTTTQKHHSTTYNTLTHKEHK